MTQVRKRKTTQREPTAEGESLPEPQETDLPDELLDEIDGVLEENAEEFVKGYAQKGGE